MMATELKKAKRCPKKVVSEGDKVSSAFLFQVRKNTPRMQTGHKLARGRFDAAGIHNRRMRRCIPTIKPMFWRSADIPCLRVGGTFLSRVPKPAVGRRRAEVALWRAAKAENRQNPAMRDSKACATLADQISNVMPGSMSN